VITGAQPGREYRYTIFLEGHEIPVEPEPLGPGDMYSPGSSCGGLGEDGIAAVVGRGTLWIGSKAVKCKPDVRVFLYRPRGSLSRNARKQYYRGVLRLQDTHRTPSHYPKYITGVSTSTSVTKPGEPNARSTKGQRSDHRCISLMLLLHEVPKPAEIRSPGCVGPPKRKREVSQRIRVLSLNQPFFSTRGAFYNFGGVHPCLLLCTTQWVKWQFKLSGRHRSNEHKGGIWCCGSTTLASFTFTL